MLATHDDPAQQPVLQVDNEQSLQMPPAHGVEHGEHKLPPPPHCA